MADGSQRWHRFLHLCLPWPGATVRTKTTVLVVIAVLAVILFFNGFASYRATLDPAHKARVVEHLREFLGQGLTTSSRRTSLMSWPARISGMSSLIGRKRL
jgi:hypothetical protein